MVARFVRDEEAAGSNPVTPTSKTAGHRPCPTRHRAFLLAVQAAKYSSRCHFRLSPRRRKASLVAAELAFA